MKIKTILVLLIFMTSSIVNANTINSFENKDNVITLLTPNGGEMWNLTQNITWNITGELPFKPFAVTIQYKNETCDWTTIIEDREDISTPYKWDTTTVSDGDNYLIKVILKEDFDINGTYETYWDNDTSDETFIIKNNPSPNTHPPETPDPPVGPTEGMVGVQYNYTFTTTDPDGNKIQYLVDWDDGTCDALNPYESGEIVNVSHVWTSCWMGSKETFNVKVMAVDSETHENSDWSKSLNVTIYEKPEPPINLTISIIKGLSIGRIFAKVKNIDENNASNVNCKIKIKGGFFKRISISKQDTISILSNSSITISSWSFFTRIVRKFGFIDITVEVSKNDKIFRKNATGFVLGRIVLVF